MGGLYKKDIETQGRTVIICHLSSRKGKWVKWWVLCSRRVGDGAMMR